MQRMWFDFGVVPESRLLCVPHADEAAAAGACRNEPTRTQLTLRDQRGKKMVQKAKRPPVRIAEDNSLRGYWRKHNDCYGLVRILPNGRQKNVGKAADAAEAKRKLKEIWARDQAEAVLIDRDKRMEATQAPPEPDVAPEAPPPGESFILWRCRECGAHWREFQTSWSLHPDHAACERCDNAPGFDEVIERVPSDAENLAVFESAPAVAACPDEGIEQAKPTGVGSPLEMCTPDELRAELNARGMNDWTTRVSDAEVLAEVQRRIALTGGILDDFEVSIQSVPRHLLTIGGAVACGAMDRRLLTDPREYLMTTCSECIATELYRTLDLVLGEGL